MVVTFMLYRRLVHIESILRIEMCIRPETALCLHFYLYLTEVEEHGEIPARPVAESIA